MSVLQTDTGSVCVDYVTVGATNPCNPQWQPQTKSVCAYVCVSVHVFLCYCAHIRLKPSVSALHEPLCGAPSGSESLSVCVTKFN